MLFFYWIFQFGNKLNNNLNNLEYVTKQENTKHAFKLGLKIAKKGSDCNLSKLKESEVFEIKKMIQSGMKNKDIAKIFKIDPSTISYIKTGKTWQHLK